MIRPAVPKDLDPLCDMATRFMGETHLPLTLDEEKTRQIFWDGINNDENILLINEIDGVIAGAIFGYMHSDWCVEKEAYITKMFVEKEFRGLEVSMDLIKGFEEQTKEAVITYTSATAGMGETIEKLYVRLYQRAGYNILGRVLMKERL